MREVQRPSTTTSVFIPVHPDQVSSALRAAGVGNRDGSGYGVTHTPGGARLSSGTPAHLEGLLEILRAAGLPEAKQEASAP